MAISPDSSNKTNFPCTGVATAVDGSGISMGIGSSNTHDVYSWGTSNASGKLCRRDPLDHPTPRHVPAKAHYDGPSVPRRVYVGGTEESGHAALLTMHGELWMCGCDRWQQLGLGSPHGGASGYTWTQIWHTQFQRNHFVSNHVTIRDVALGGDHTLVLANDKDGTVYSFGKGAEGQLGLRTKPFVHAPTPSPKLSHPHNAAVCAIRDCSLTLDPEGRVQQMAGKCRNFEQALAACRQRARTHGLLQESDKSASGEDTAPSA
ncbi:predicted protein [Phaeodactylum tricornutum CCAP 1055/1]|jgi:hypothetical protein|uniref:Regulator of chromosome condensation n=1 Tax=Phaeodactylum tricornutum (strain CCAP 1055/1) TaxID=556484 RepID=B7GCL9_PHATC|nr:predicted protein [Phaeodactylum tricornutum CCAP 1055/1]EEC43567.1 predicted protein [Phaeodactylum tricornutum CCAP 1055/1]|eukprot:XP_002184831.1 predicted protein [Phaeodactylum tricornutum CCAP 1055/1]